MPAVLIVVASSLLLGIAVYWFGARRSNYRHVRHTISELGERGAADARIVSYGVFLPLGFCFATVWLAQRTIVPYAADLAGAIAVGYLGAALFPCDPGSPMRGSVAQTIHNVAGGVQYVGGAFALWGLGEGADLFRWLSVVVASAAVWMAFPQHAPYRGAVQRIAEVALLVGLALALGLSAGASRNV